MFCNTVIVVFSYL